MNLPLSDDLGVQAASDFNLLRGSLGDTMTISSKSLSGIVSLRKIKERMAAEFLASGVGVNVMNRDMHLIGASPSVWTTMPTEGDEATFTTKPGLVYKLSKAYSEGFVNTNHSQYFIAYREAPPNTATADGSGNRRYTNLPKNPLQP